MTYKSEPEEISGRLGLSRKAQACPDQPDEAKKIEVSTRGYASFMKVAIIGAGASGLVCAIEAARKGHKVSVFEKIVKLGEKF